MRALISASVLVVLSLPDDAPGGPKQPPAEDILFPLPPEEVSAKEFEQRQQEAAKKPSSVTYTRVEYDGKAYWVVQASFGFGDPSSKIAVYAPTKGGPFRRPLKEQCDESRRKSHRFGAIASAESERCREPRPLHAGVKK